MFVTHAERGGYECNFSFTCTYTKRLLVVWHMSTFSAQRLQKSAKELFLGCVNPASWPAAGARFTQPREHSLADICTMNVKIAVERGLCLSAVVLVAAVCNGKTSRS